LTKADVQPPVRLKKKNNTEGNMAILRIKTRINHVTRLSVMVLLLLLWQLTWAETQVERDVVFGVTSGVALLADIYHPTDPIERAIVLIPGSGWDGREVGYTDFQLKDGYPYVNNLRNSLVDSGFTVFVINHRAAPVHKYPKAVLDAKRAIRFVRANAENYSIDPEQIGAIGHSSGGHLASLLGVMDEDSNRSHDNTPAASESVRVQAVVAIAAPQDMTINARIVAPYTVAFMGEAPPMDEQFENYIRSGVYAEASPVSHVTSDDAAFMLIYATQDRFVSADHMRIMEEALNLAELPVESLLIDEETHDPTLDYSAIVGWFNEHLNVGE
jgi:acetyl esterase/lipase